MKNIKRKILVYIVAAIAAIAAMFFIAFNLFISSYFETEARKAIQNNIDNNNSEYYNEIKNIFSSYLKYYTFSGEYDDLMNEPDISESKTMKEYFIKNNLPKNQVLSLNTGDHDYIFAVNTYIWNHYEFVDGYADEDSELVGEEETYLIYVDIMPVLSYTKTLNWIFVAILIGVTAVMAFLGLKFGQKIENAQNNQNKFFQNASHELKTPLMSIQGYAEAIQADIMDHHKAADIIMNESDRMSSLVEEILAISKIDSGQLKLNLANADIREILYDCLQSEDVIFKNKSIDIDLDFDEKKVMVRADDVQLRRAFMNIISNDVRYCQKKIIISCKIVKDKAVIKFTDDGPGLDSETQEKIFARFYMGKNGQTGIGMALTKEIITLHNGTIKAYNEKKGGTVFEIQLPAANAGSC